MSHLRKRTGRSGLIPSGIIAGKNGLICIMFCGDIETDCTRKHAHSFSAPVSKNVIPYLAFIPCAYFSHGTKRRGIKPYRFANKAFFISTTTFNFQVLLSADWQSITMR